MSTLINQNYQQAKELYASHGIDTEEVIKKLADVKISMHCWQGDDVRGFMNQDQELTAWDLCYRQLSRGGDHSRRAAAGSGKGILAYSRKA